MILNKKLLEHLASLARIEISFKEEDKFLSDLEKILEYFKELEALDTKDIVPVSGGTELKNVFRNDEAEVGKLDARRVTEAFPETDKGFLKVPPVFSAEGGSASGGE